MISKLFEECRWCNGIGKELDGHYPCPDCEGTGIKGGKFALEKFDEFIDKMTKLPVHSIKTIKSTDEDIRINITRNKYENS